MSRNKTGKEEYSQQVSTRPPPQRGTNRTWEENQKESESMRAEIDSQQREMRVSMYSTETPPRHKNE